uniref:hypothetical protein n=1 Tax=Brachyspira catarrhinii TaxID=2528966 RepID=UPI003F4C8123
MKKIFLFTIILSIMLSGQIYPNIVMSGKYICEDRPNCYFTIKKDQYKPNYYGVITYYDGNMGVSMEGRVESNRGSKIMTVYWSTGLVEELRVINDSRFYAGDFKWIRTTR